MKELDVFLLLLFIYRKHIILSDSFLDKMRDIYSDQRLKLLIKLLIGKLLCGNSIADCEFMFSFGSGQNGKSTLDNIWRAVLEKGAYVQDFNNTVFDSDAEFNKSFRYISPDIRFFFVEELLLLVLLNFTK